MRETKVTAPGNGVSYGSHTRATLHQANRAWWGAEDVCLLSHIHILMRPLPVDATSTNGFIDCHVLLFVSLEGDGQGILP